MARAIWSGFLSFGLVNVPVGLYSATADQTVHFNQLHRGTSHRVRYKKVDEVTGEELGTDDIVNGYPLGGGEYVVVARDELREAAPGKSDLIEISDFVDLAEIDPMYFRQTYYLGPRGKGADRAYALLRQAMEVTAKVGIATLVLRDKEHLVAVRPGERVLLLETMFFADEIRPAEEQLEGLPPAIEPEARELKIARQLVESLSADWDPARYRNTYRERVEELVASKQAGRSVVFETERPKSNVVDLMAALEASVARGRSAGRTTRSAEAEPVEDRPPDADVDVDVDAAEAGSPGAGRPGRREGRPRAAAAGSPPAARRPRRPPAGEQQHFEGMSKSELLELAAARDVPGRTRMTKLQLVEALVEAEAATPVIGSRRRTAS